MSEDAGGLSRPATLWVCDCLIVGFGVLSVLGFLGAGVWMAWFLRGSGAPFTYPQARAALQGPGMADALMAALTGTVLWGWALFLAAFVLGAAVLGVWGHVSGGERGEGDE